MERQRTHGQPCLVPATLSRIPPGQVSVGLYTGVDRCLDMLKIYRRGALGGTLHACRIPCLQQGSHCNRSG